MRDERPLVRATYRLQLGSGFGFEAVARLGPYFENLGISHVYLSPCLQAGPGSTHGYDVVDHDRVNEELGGSSGFATMCESLRRRHVGVIVDVVPNHMSIANPRLNPWWWDVLENGRSSLYARYFDVDWRYRDDRMRNRVLVPILGDRYGRVLEAGRIRLGHSGADFVVRVYEHELPVAPISLAVPLRSAGERCGSDDLVFVADTLAALPSPTRTDAESRSRRHRDKAAIGRFLAKVVADDAAAARAIDDELEDLNRDKARLHEILERQNYRLAYWKAARHDLDYRRFFDINELAALRMEDEAVFEATHKVVLDWVAGGTVAGLRIDHPDGLRDPEQYFRRLRRRAPHCWIVAEKILAHEEELPPSWPIDGTTGYDFLGLVGGLFVDPAAEEPLSRICAEFEGEVPTDFETLVRDKKRFVLRHILASDVTRLTAGLVRVCESHLEYRDFSRTELRAALEEVIVWLPLYRTYVRAGEGATERDAETIQATVDRARTARPELDPQLFGFLCELLLDKHAGAGEAELFTRFQQISGAAMAKGVEDTAFYCFHRLVSLNEVGADPGCFGTSPEQFHRHCLRMQAAWPRTMLATSTHDTKRSEDVRIRIALLSEIPGRWTKAVRRWSRHNERHKTDGWPDRAIEYLLYQTMVGAWPLGEERLVGYMRKAAREAKVHTSWTQPNEAYDAALESFCVNVCRDDEFQQELDAFLQPLATAARAHALAQVLLKLCAPGVPDIYQGNELWDFSLTDPDNRRPVDFGLRQRLLEELPTLEVGDVLARADEGLPKLWLTHRALQVRRRHPEAFGPGGVYRPLHAVGARDDRVIAFSRGAQIVAVAPRLTVAAGGWSGTKLGLPPGKWHNALTGQTGLAGEIPLARLLSTFPVALLEREA